MKKNLTLCFLFIKKNYSMIKFQGILNKYNVQKWEQSRVQSLEVIKCILSQK